MGADCFFRMGSRHHVCQDYARTGGYRGYTIAALSDGCSSSPDTDFGARFLVQAFMQVPMATGDSVAMAASCMAAASGLPRSCLDATLLAVFESGIGVVHAIRAGDGVFAYRDRDGTWFYDQVEFGNNAPAYLSYRLNRELMDRHLSLSPT